MKTTIHIFGDVANIACVYGVIHRRGYPSSRFNHCAESKYKKTTCDNLDIGHLKSGLNIFSNPSYIVQRVTQDIKSNGGKILISTDDIIIKPIKKPSGGVGEAPLVHS